ncbi:MAG: ScpA family protein [archaeon]
MELNIEQILQSERAWEYVLLDIVKSEDLDPWDIDIVKLTETYIERIRKMKQLDLRIPARIILAASVLLRMQSEQLMPREEEEALDNLMEEWDSEFPSEVEEEEQGEVPLLDIRLRRKPHRKVTLTDLLGALSKGLAPKPPRIKMQKFVLDLPEFDISQQIEDLHKKIIENTSNRIAFSEFTPNRTRDEIVDVFMPILHLANEHKITLEQEKLFGEFYIVKNKA